MSKLFETNSSYSYKFCYVFVQIFKCVQRNCSSMFESLDQFLEHTAAHQADIDTHYTCCHCRLMFCSLDELGRHQSLGGPCLKKRLRSVTNCYKLCATQHYLVDFVKTCVIMISPVVFWPVFMIFYFHTIMVK